MLLQLYQVAVEPAWGLFGDIKGMETLQTSKGTFQVLVLIWNQNFHWFYPFQEFYMTKGKVFLSGLRKRSLWLPRNIKKLFVVHYVASTLTRKFPICTMYIHKSIMRYSLEEFIDNVQRQWYGNNEMNSTINSSCGERMIKFVVVEKMFKHPELWPG